MSAATGSITVKNNSASLGNVYVNVAWGTNNGANKVVYTNSSGKTYYYAGAADANHIVGPSDPDGTTYLATSTYTFTVTLSVNADGTGGVPSVEALKAVKGNHTITFTATGEVKIGNSDAAALLPTAEGSTATHTITIAENEADGMSAGESGSVYYGYIGTDTAQTGTGGTITITSVE